MLTMAGPCEGTGAGTMERLVDQLGCSVGEHLAVDAAALRSIDEAGVRMLVALDSYMRARGGQMTVVAGPAVAAALRDAGVDISAGRAVATAGPGSRPHSQVLDHSGAVAPPGGRT